MATDDRTPIIVGVAQVEQREDDPTESREPLELMIEAVKKAGSDCGNPEILQQADSENTLLTVHCNVSLSFGSRVYTVITCGVIRGKGPRTPKKGGSRPVANPACAGAVTKKIPLCDWAGTCGVCDWAGPPPSWGFGVLFPWPCSRLVS